jgi:hypothetical protein
VIRWALLQAIGYGLVIGFPRNLRCLYVDQLEGVDLAQVGISLFFCGWVVVVVCGGGVGCGGGFGRIRRYSEASWKFQPASLSPSPL